MLPPSTWIGGAGVSTTGASNLGRNGNIAQLFVLRVDRSASPRRHWRMPFDVVRRALGSRSIGDRMVELAEQRFGDDIDDRIEQVETYANEVGFDPFGFDPKVARKVLAVSTLLHRAYFRTEVKGIDNLPKGRVLVIANHSGQIPIDGAIIGCSMMLDATPPRFPRSMVEKWSAELPFISVFFPRVGQVVGSPENARRLLDNEEAIVVFPEGSRGISKTFDKRYQLERFGLGFMRLALETNTPIVPVSVIGAEEQYISLGNIKPLAKLLGMPAVPIIPQAFVGAVMPLPVKYRITFGDPLRFEGDPDDEDAEIQKKVDVVRGTIQSMLNRGLKERQSIFR